MNTTDTEYHRFQRSRFEYNLIQLINDSKLHSEILKYIFTYLSSVTSTDKFGKTINSRNGIYIIQPHPLWIITLNHYLQEYKLILCIDKSEKNKIFYSIVTTEL